MQIVNALGLTVSFPCVDNPKNVLGKMVFGLNFYPFPQNSCNQRTNLKKNPITFNITVKYPQPFQM